LGCLGEIKSSGINSGNVSSPGAVAPHEGTGLDEKQRVSIELPGAQLSKYHVVECGIGYKQRYRRRTSGLRTD
jgi:hypothetical protein